MKFHPHFSYFSHGKEVCCCCGVCHSLIFLTRRYWRRGIREHGWGFHSLIFVTFKHISCIYFLKCKVKTQRTCYVVNGFPLFEVFEMYLRCLKCVWGVRTLELLKCLSEGSKHSPPKLSTMTSKDEIGIGWIGGSIFGRGMQELMGTPLWLVLIFGVNMIEDAAVLIVYNVS